MLSASSIAKLLLAIPAILDYEAAPPRGPGRQPVPRYEHSVGIYIGVDDIAMAASETSDPLTLAAELDMFGAHEGGYCISVVGDSGSSCGTFQTPCAATPGFARCTEDEENNHTKCHHHWAFHNARGVALAQARKAATVLQEWASKCDHVVWGYARGACERTHTADLYENDLNVSLSQLSTFALPE